MAIRLSGLNSGLDTEAIVSAMVMGHKAKKDKLVKSQTKLGWKQEAWKSVNTKVYGLYKDISALRYSSAYSLKKTTVSDSTKASVSASGSAINGSQELGVAQLAKAGYLTGGQLDKTGVKSSTKLSELGIDSDDGKITVTSGDGSPKTISITKDMTVGSFVDKLNEAGVKASFDETNRRFFISSKDSGVENDFSLNASNASGTNALLKLGLYTAPAAGSAQYKAYEALAAYHNRIGELGGNDGILKRLKKAHDDIDKYTEKKTKSDAAGDYATQYKYLQDLFKKTGENDKVEGGTQTIGAAAKKLDELIKAGASKAAYTDTATGKQYTRREEIKDTDGNVTGYKFFYDEEETYEEDGETKTRTVERSDEKTKAEAKGIKAYDSYRNELGFETGLLTREAQKNEDNTEKTDELGNTIYDYVEIKDDEGNSKASAFLHARIVRDEYEGKAAPADMTPESEGYDKDAVAIRDNIAKIQEAYNAGSFDADNASKIEGTAAYYNKLSADSQAALDEANTTINNDKALDAYRDEDDDPVQARIDEAYKAVNGQIDVSNSPSAGATRVNGQNAVIFLNGAKFEGASNKFSINGLTINATGTTGNAIKDGDGNITGVDGSSVTITTATDVDGIYDKVKDFLSKYNEVVNSLSSLYNADSAKGYEPLTDEEREELTDTQAEKWEQKIKDSLLRRDQTLGKILSTMSNAMIKTYTVGDKKYSLSSFGINTLGYFNADVNEKYAYHIDGDEDDSSTSTKQDKLRAAIEDDPEAVTEFLKQITDGLYKGLDATMKRTTMSSAYTVYNDKEMAKEYSSYNSQIKKWEDRITTMEESYFKKFTAMEKALATMQSNSSSLTGLLGG